MYKRKTASIVKREGSSAAGTSSAMKMMMMGAGNVDSDESQAHSQTYEPVSISMDTSPDPPTPIKSPSQSQSQSQPGQQRSVGSLVLLTQKFVELMKANGGSIDLKAVRSGFTYKSSPLNQSFIYPSAGHQNFGRTEAPNIRHYQCSGGHWTNR